MTMAERKGDFTPVQSFDAGFHAGWEAAIEEALIKIDLFKEAHPSDIAAHVAALAEKREP